jgi:23S rRNA (guanine745-N1)-methyltransferase
VVGAPTLSLLCTVRGCRKPLARAERRLVCGSDHSFDVARSGYVNLLQPQDRRSSRPGDSSEALAARHRLLEGVEAPLVAAIVDTLSLTEHDVILDVGCGEGHHLAAIARRFGCGAHGLDISVPAIDAAARRHPGLEWVVANADRFVPYVERAFSVVASITGRKNAEEFRRVIRPDGLLLVVVPAADDLMEVRRAVLGEGVLHDRIERTVATFAPLFALERHERLRRVVRLDRGIVADVMTGSYRGLRRTERARLEAVADLEVTLSRDLLLLRPAGSALH